MAPPATDDTGSAGGSGRYRRVREDLQRVATHVLARARYGRSGRFGLRVTADGLATPAYGPHGDVLRIAGTSLVREHQGTGPARCAVTPMDGASMNSLAAFAGVDLNEPFSVGGDTPALGDPDAVLDLPPGPAHRVTAWLRLGAEVIDRALAEADDPAVVQLWPEHFDVGVDVATAGGRVTLGASPGDSGHPEPYLYVSPWEEVRPEDDPGFWNAPFGALLGEAALAAAPDPVETGAAFLVRGLSHLR